MLWLALGVLLGILRVTGIKSIVFQAIAHVYMGSLGTTWWFQRKPWLAWLFVALCVLEVVCFIASKMTP